MGLDGKHSVGVALFRSNSNRDSELQQACKARLGAAATRAAAFNYHSTRRSGAARAGRFPVSSRIDPGVRGNLSGYLLGKPLVA